ncbi:MAG: PASTA domain-containing protein, partial [Calditrichaeota bacterium]
TAVGSKIAALNLQGVRIEKDTRRNYPHQEVASHVLGFTDADNKGIEGVEYYYNDYFTGQDGWSLIQRDGRGRAVPEQVIRSQEPVNGQSLVLNIDLIFQSIATEELKAASRKYNASSGSVIILDPNTGNILAMANEPGYNPNAPTNYSIASRRNLAITDAYEPGSTFKIVPFAGLLESKKLKLNEAVFCENGSYTVRGRTIRDTSPHGWLVPSDVMRYSSNIGIVKLTRNLGNAALYNTVKLFGFGNKTDVEFSGENSGSIRDIPEWSSFSQASIAIGQEISVNALQVALAYAAIANGGNLLQPHLVRGVLLEDGTIEKIPHASEETMPKRIISAETADQLKKYLVKVVEEGTGKDAAIPRIRVAGKTGTAQVPRKDGKGYSTTDFISSFIGFFPAEKPQYLIYVVLHTDRVNQWGSKAAVPTFQRIAKRISVNLQQTESNFTEVNPAESKRPETFDMQQIIVPDVQNRRFETAVAALQDLGLHTVFTGEGEFVNSQFPAPGTRLSAGDEIKLERFTIVTSDGYTKMPDLVGLSLREALNRMAISDLEPMVYGNGKVVRQKPAPHTPVRTGIRCVIECETPNVKIPFFSQVN